jgi:Glycosyl transferases group 1
MSEQVVLLTEPILREEFIQTRLVMPLAIALTQRFAVTIASPSVGDGVRETLRRAGVQVVDAGLWFPTPRHSHDEAASFVLSWSREAALRLNTRWTERRVPRGAALRVNLSMTNTAPSDVWYLQGRPLGPSLRLAIPNFRSGFRAIASATEPVVRLLDAHRFAAGAREARTLLTNCEYLGAWYREHGYRIDRSIPSFLYPMDFRPTSSTPRRDYVLVYLGKETEVDAIADLLRLGLPLKAFGGKTADWVAGRLGPKPPPNLTLCGRVGHAELLELYTHARFTAFPFTDEPFGLVPIESMACGTPVLTYAAQGPGETVLDGKTGWLARDRAELVARGRELFRHELPPGISEACVRRAQHFSLESVAREWTTVIEAHLDRGPPPSEEGSPGTPRTDGPP